MTFDGKAFGADIVAIVKGHVERSLAPLNARLDAFEKMIAALPVPKDGADGKSITLADVAPTIKAEAERVGAGILDAAKASVAELVAAIPPAVNGKDADAAAIAEEVTGIVVEGMKGLLPDAVSRPQVADMISRALADQPAPDQEAMTEFFKAHIGEQVALTVAALPPAEKGKDADPVEVAALVTQEAERILAGWDKPQDGKSITVDDVRPLIDEAVTKSVTLIPVPKDGADGKDGRDGLDVVKFIRDDRGHLNGILRDGTTVDLGEYVGKDGAPGINGKDGADGVGFDDMDLDVREDGTFLRFTRGDVVKEFRIAGAYRGVFKDGVYRVGDSVSFGGSQFIAERETSAKPETPDSGWRLAVKRGRDGKDGELKAPIKVGPVKVN